MLTYSELKTKPARFLSMTGHTDEEFETILPSFSQAWAEDLAKRAQEKSRQRKVGGGRKPILKTDAERLLFILVYFKLYPLQEAQGAFFGMSQSQANEWIQRLTPILKSALGKEKVLPEREPSTLPELLAAYDLLEFGLDGTERRIQRPQEAQTQRDYYSGKKKRIP